MDTAARIHSPLRPRHLALAVVLLAALVGSAWLSMSTAGAQETFVVTSPGDAADVEPGDGECATADGDCTLRAAIQEANAVAGLDSITFTLDGATTITPAAALPVVSDAVALDAADVTLDGSSAGPDAPGLHIAGGESTVRGLTVHSFDGPSLLLSTANENTVQDSVLDVLELTDNTDGNVIGSAGAGNEIGQLSIVRGVEGGSAFNTVQANTIQRIEVLESALNTIGGLEAGQGNTVTDGIRLARSFGDLVAGNLIGTDGVQALGSGTGLQVFGVGTDIVGNVVSGNAGDGIDYSSTGPEAAFIRGNLIGTDASGTVALPNGGAGIRVSAGGHDVRIGGADAGAGNVIAHNGLGGVLVSDVQGAATGNLVLGNSIFANGGLGIDLNGDGVTANDPGDLDPGFEGIANNLQNFPVLDADELAAGHVAGTLDSRPGDDYRIEVFASAEPDASGYGEGARLIGATTIEVHPGGDAPFTVDLGEGNLTPGEWLTATATNLRTGDTSEFSLAVQVGGEAPSEPPADLALLVSASADRSGAQPLDGATLEAGAAYVLVPEDGVDFVAFFVDDPSRSGLAYQVENVQPYDLAGTAGDGSAWPLDLASLGAGTHTVTATVFMDDGTEHVLNAAFEVGSDAGGDPNGEPPDDGASDDGEPADGGDEGDTAAFTLMVAPASEAGQPFALDGAVLSGEVVASLEPAADVRLVRVALDGRPFAEFAGNALLSMPGSPRNPFDTTRLEDGEHTLAVQAELASGETVTLSATFQVQNDPDDGG
ncbi:MAG: hypothetical protein GEU80_10550 [Dehalococcoidia bacterium]|nr:hypothetical protein [Dehalococcoidia bacterium]